MLAKSPVLADMADEVNFATCDSFAREVKGGMTFPPVQSVTHPLILKSKHACQDPKTKH